MKVIEAREMAITSAAEHMAMFHFSRKRHATANVEPDRAGMRYCDDKAPIFASNNDGIILQYSPKYFIIC